ncbi:MAG: hypothetical protein JWR36_798 [Glaciihabitans sp.]|jgi:hypothetical protein|nr:hypothetical protein [Glaciihabitans sp.]MDQ1569971.1 hypothetical protein [Actinomycetota bacterium]
MINIGIPRYLIVGMGALFSAYHLVLATYSLTQHIPFSPGPIFIAMALYAAATTLSLLPFGPTRMPMWMAAFNLAVVVALPLLVTHELDPTKSNGYATWYVAAVGTLMTITSTRRRHTFAWIGVGFLVVQTILWAGPGALGGIGVIGSVVWVGVSHILSSGMAKATRDAQRFALAEREATDWQAAQEAHVFERQFRLGQTSTMALEMLREIEASNGRLTDEQRQECLHLEGAIRDEIRGRKLLNDAVRDEVMVARRRGATVTLLDEGGLDDLSDFDLERVLNRLAQALAGTDADKVIARTVPEGSDVAITVVGLRTVGDGSASALGQESLEDDEVALWLEIPRAVA